MSAVVTKVISTETFAHRSPGAAPKDIFNDPFDPARSIQLNNRHWPSERFGLLSVLGDAEQLVHEGRLSAAASVCRGLRKLFLKDEFFNKFLRRLHRLHTFRSAFGCAIHHIDIDEDVLKRNQYRGEATRASYPLSSSEFFGRLIAETTKIYRREYGADLLRVNCTVRFAKPDERKSDITEYGPLSDFHNDEYKGITTIIYLSNVKDENGAFSYVRGSHLIPRSLVLSAIHQVVHFDMGLARKEQLNSVPLEFRGSVGMGNFLDDEKVTVLSRSCESVEGRVGTCVTFNGQYVIHRGGKPLEGSRTAAFIQPESVFLHKLKGLRSLAFSLKNQ